MDELNELEEKIKRQDDIIWITGTLALTILGLYFGANYAEKIIDKGKSAPAPIIGAVAGGVAMIPITSAVFYALTHDYDIEIVSKIPPNIKCTRKKSNKQ